MKIFITIPSFALHGGIRIILEHANRLAERHEVSLYPLRNGPCDWFDISKKVHIERNTERLWMMDAMVITSPHTIHLQEQNKPVKKILFQQMMEHMFLPNDKLWQAKCKSFYQSPYPIMTLAEWNIEEMKRRYQRNAPTYLIGNGVNLDHFPISRKKKKGKIVLVEGWECTNPTKDVDGIGPQVAWRLKRDGYKIIAYGIKPLQTFSNVPDEYHLNPPLALMNELYERATILLKASRYDDRACAPMEAMTKGTVTARALIKGDEDLIDGYNCLRSDYSQWKLYDNAKKLLEDDALRQRLALNGIQHLKENSWERWMDVVEKLIVDN